MFELYILIGKGRTHNTYVLFLTIVREDLSVSYRNRLSLHRENQHGRSRKLPSMRMSSSSTISRITSPVSSQSLFRRRISVMWCFFPSASNVSSCRLISFRSSPSSVSVCERHTSHCPQSTDFVSPKYLSNCLLRQTRPFCA